MKKLVLVAVALAVAGLGYAFRGDLTTLLTSGNVDPHKPVGMLSSSSKGDDAEDDKSGKKEGKKSIEAIKYGPWVIEVAKLKERLISQGMSEKEADAYVEEEAKGWIETISDLIKKATGKGYECEWECTWTETKAGVDSPGIVVGPEGDFDAGNTDQVIQVPLDADKQKTVTRKSTCSEVCDMEESCYTSCTEQADGSKKAGCECRRGTGGSGINGDGIGDGRSAFP